MARELAADNMTGVVVLSGEISAPPDAAHIYGWQTYGERRGANSTAAQGMSGQP